MHFLAFSLEKSFKKTFISPLANTKHRKTQVQGEGYIRTFIVKKSVNIKVRVPTPLCKSMMMNLFCKKNPYNGFFLDQSVVKHWIRLELESVRTSGRKSRLCYATRHDDVSLFTFANDD